MMSLAYIFPGQGSQKVGMGSELAQRFSTARAVFDEADAILGRRLSQLCFEGPAEVLQRTENTQLAMLTCSIATLRILEESGLSAQVVAGHSLGEYSALVAARVLDFPDALKLVEHRAQFMAEASERQDCSMAAILGLDADVLQGFIENARAIGVVGIANYNCPGQLIISGETQAVDRVIESATEKVGARRCVRLPVSGAFHSALMVSAGEQLASIIDTFKFEPPQTKWVANVTGALVSEPADVRQLLIYQITHPVQWERSIQSMREAGISHFIEIGPGRVLCGMVRRILSDATCLNVEDAQSLEKTLEEVS